jgi:hypothetical protein
MPKKLKLDPHLSQEEIIIREKESASVTERLHWQVVRLIGQGKRTGEVAEVSGYSAAWVRALIRRCNAQGPSTIGDQRQHNQGGQRLLDAKQEADLREEFPKLVSYPRFVALMPQASMVLMAYLQTCMGNCTGISFVDSTPLAVCHDKRIARHRAFDGFAARGKTSMGWFYGFKLHLVVNECGELVAFQLTPANTDDRQPVPTLSRRLFGKLFGDKGYLSQQLFEQLFEQGIKLITMVRKNMKNRLVLLQEKLLSRQRSIIETINDQLKNISQIEHSRHRSVNNFVVNLFAGLIAYCHQEKTLSLHLDASLLPATV